MCLEYQLGTIRSVTICSGAIFVHQMIDRRLILTVFTRRPLAANVWTYKRKTLKTIFKRKLGDILVMISLTLLAMGYLEIALH